MQKIILASQSVQRQLLMKTLNIPFEIKPANINEQLIEETSQILRAKMIAQTKAKKILSIYPKDIVIAADTFTVFNNRIYEKPNNLESAKNMLREQAGKQGFCYTGFSYTDKVNNIVVNKTITTKFELRELSEKEIDTYVNNNPVLTWSAAFSPAYPSGINLISNVSGSLSSFTHGLPMEILIPLLKKSKAF